jgi:hypothetical protein
MEQGREAMASRGFIWGLWIPGKEGWGDVLGGYVWKSHISMVRCLFLHLLEHAMMKQEED